MGLFSDILLTSDLDRTLTARDAGIPEENIRAIRYFMENGGAFTVNTGRSLAMFTDYLDRIPVNAPLLLFNGSAAYDPETGSFRRLRPMKQDPVRTVRFLMERYPDTSLEVQGLHAHYVFRENAGWADFYRDSRCPWILTEPEQVPGPFLKVTLLGKLGERGVAQLFRGTEAEWARFDAIQRELETIYGDTVTLFRSGARVIDLHAPGISKARAARELQKELGRKILVCAGDGCNDISMMEDADFSFCPADCSLAQRFPAVCECDRGAVAEIIYQKIPEILEKGIDRIGNPC